MHVQILIDSAAKSAKFITSENNELYFFLLYLHDAHGLLRALHSHNPTQYSNIVWLASHFYSHIGAGH
ncbi:hypothetical protein DWV67_07815 [Dorea formicigenerans]|uniref:Uncharacterized protein n=1 Tax=Dorea formicigenerans TaxID=39486 RepID=A0A395XN29_9FIRM|nr:hypothetical protein DWV67_07815 [Dorea formicigenerans]